VRLTSLTTGGECTMYGMEIDVIHGEHEGLIFSCWCLVAPMALERKVIPIHNMSVGYSMDVGVRKYGL
jgi:hypothetical protein